MAMLCNRYSPEAFSLHQNSTSAIGADGKRSSFDMETLGKSGKRATKIDACCLDTSCYAGSLVNGVGSAQAWSKGLGEKGTVKGASGSCWAWNGTNWSFGGSNDYENGKNVKPDDRKRTGSLDSSRKAKKRKARKKRPSLKPPKTREKKITIANFQFSTCTYFSPVA